MVEKYILYFNVFLLFCIVTYFLVIPRTIFKKPSCGGTTKLTIFAVSKDEWNTKEDTGRTMKNILFVLWYGKRHHSG